MATNAYLHAMAHRLLLAVIALLTGLAALAVPAQARVSSSDGTQVGAVYGSDTATAKAEATLAFPTIHAAFAAFVIDRAAPVTPVSAPMAKPVLAGIDRAHE